MYMYKQNREPRGVETVEAVAAHGVIKKKFAIILHTQRNWSKYHKSWKGGTRREKNLCLCFVQKVQQRQLPLLPFP